MKNLNYYAFERNHYYYGKLMTVEDFEVEQRYMNNKRRVANRLLQGMGVVFGLQVVLIDDRTISIKSGYALDHNGREILLLDGVTKKLSDISGFETFQENNNSFVYLCVEYTEEKSERVYNTAGGDSLSGGNEYNKYRESYRFFLTSNEPKDIGMLSMAEAFEHKSVLYAGNGIRICQTIPKFVKAGEEFELIIDIENMGQQGEFAFSYELELKHIKNGNLARLKVDFDEKRKNKSYSYRETYRLKAQDAADITASLNVLNEEINIVLMGEIKTEQANSRSEIRITSDDALLNSTRYFYESEMEAASNYLNIPNLYLAKIYMVKEEETYVIQHLEPMPYNQYMWNTRLNGFYQKTLFQEINKLKSHLAKEFANDSRRDSKAGTKNVTYGNSILDLGTGKQKGKVFFTEEISHGLGIGEVNIQIGISENNKEIMWGSSKVFQDSKPKVEMGAKVFVEKGTFIIGALLLDACAKNQCVVYWRAEKNLEKEVQGDSEKAIIVSPNFMNVKVRQTVYIEAECRNMNDKRLRWSVEKYGGIIDNHGMYTAPDKEGVYEITVSSFVYPNVSTSLYIVVRGDDL